MRSSLRIGAWFAAFLVAWVPARAGAQAVDLTVSAFSGAPATATQGQAFAVSSTVRTTGAVNRSFTVGFYLSADRTITTADALIGSRTVASLPRNGTSTATTAVRVPAGLAPGSYTIGAFVDTARVVAETNEGNNARAGSVVRVVSAPVDLTMTALSGAPAAVTPGASFSLSSTVVAAPTGASGAFVVNLYLSSDAIVTTADVFIGSRFVGGLAAGASSTATSTVTLPSTLVAGAYRLGAIVDALGQVAETNEANNALLGGTVQVAPLNPCDGSIPIDDGNPCTADACDPALGVTHAALPTGTSCSDGNACNGLETCNGAGACLAGVPPAIDDGNPCTADACDPVAGVTHLPATAGASCSDGTVCNGDELCDGGGACRAGVAPVIDDGNPCTSDACDPASGVVHVVLAEGASCSDGNACNGLEACDAGGVCQAGIPPAIDDGNACTADTCDPLLGVRHLPLIAGSPCSDGNACNGAETCDGSGSCLGGVPPALDDGNRCTADSCVPALGVRHEAIPGCAVASTCLRIPGLHFVHDAAGNLTEVVDAASDPANCGCPGRVCPGPAAVCVNGMCGAMGSGGFVGTMTDPLNCGAIGSVCAGAPGAQPVCTNGTCGLACNAGFADAQGRCLDLATDPWNCGGVGNACTASGGGAAICRRGACSTTAAPVVYAVNGVAPPGTAFRNALNAGIQIVGANLNGITAIEVEDWGFDAEGGVLDGAPSTPVYGWTWSTLWAESDFSVRNGTLIEVPTATWGWTLWRWLKLRLHYQGNGLGEQMLADVAVSLDPDAPVPRPAPTIESVDAVRVFVVGYDQRDHTKAVWGYNPATGFLAIKDDHVADLTKLQPPPQAVVDGLAEYHVLAVEWNGVYLRAGMDLTFQRDGTNYVSVVFPASGPWAGSVHLKPDYRTPNGPDVPSPGVIIRGTGLYADGALRLTGEAGEPVSGDLSSVWFLGDRALVMPLAGLSAPAAAVTFDSPRGSASSDPVQWRNAPLISGVAPPAYLRTGAPVTLVGSWFTGVSEVWLSFGGLSERLLPAAGATCGPGEFRVVDDAQLELLAAPSGTVPRGLVESCVGSQPTREAFPGSRRITVKNPDGQAWISLAAVDPSGPVPPASPLTCPTYVGHPDISGGVSAPVPQSPPVPVPAPPPTGCAQGSWVVCVP